MGQYEDIAKKAYDNDKPEVLKKAIAAGKAIDNALKLEYTKGGTTNSHFMMQNYLAYFDYQAMGKERSKLLYK
jgi:hypothetical protein